MQHAEIQQILGEFFMAPRKTQPAEIQPDLPTEKAYSLLSMQLKKLQDLKGRNYQEVDAAETEWVQFTEKLIIRSFGNASTNYRNFRHAGSAGEYVMVPYGTGIPHGQNQRNFESRLQAYETALKSCLSELEIDLPSAGDSGVDSRENRPFPVLVRPTMAASAKVESSPDGPAPGSDESRRVWVVYGRDKKHTEGMFGFLRAIGLHPIEFSKARALTGKPMPYIQEILHAAFAHAQAVVVLLTPDDVGKLRSEWLQPDDQEWERSPTPQARQNVIFEAGMALASHPERTILVQTGNIRPFTDVAGLHTVRMDNSAAKRKDLAFRLKDAGCFVDLDGEDWLHIGDFTPNPEPTEENTLPPKLSASAEMVDENYELVRERWRQIKDVALKEAVRFLFREDLTTRQALHLLHQLGLGMNFGGVFEGVADTTNLVQRVLPNRQPDEDVHGYTGPWTINPKFRSALELVIRQET